MLQFYDSLRALIGPDMITKASTVLGERESKVSNAVSSIISSFLGVMLKKGKTPQIKLILEEAGNLNILSDITNICQEKPTQQQQKIGDDLLQHLLGDKAADFTDPIAAQSDISKPATNRLVSMVAPIVAGFMGNKLVKEQWTVNKLFTEIDNQKNTFAGRIPEGIVKSFGLNSILNTTNNPNAITRDEKKKGGWGWLTWVILLILLLLIFFWWRSCRDNRTDTMRTNAVVTDTVVPTRVESATTMNTVNARQSTEMVLPNGERIQVYEDGTEEEMVDFLQSDDYRDASDADLRETWFQFDNIAFEFGSATELKPGSRAQLNNIAAVLRNYPDARVKIAGFADRRGTEQTNMEVSRERAKTIERLLEEAGVGNQVIRTEGYGDEYAKHSADASDSERMEDRDIALRFVKVTR